MIVIFDDEPHHQLHLEILLSENNVIKWCKSVDQMMALTEKESSDDVDLLLLDVMMRPSKKHFRDIDHRGGIRTTLFMLEHLSSWIAPEKIIAISNSNETDHINKVCKKYGIKFYPKPEFMGRYLTILDHLI